MPGSIVILYEKDEFMNMILFCGCTADEEAIIPALSRYASLLCFSPEEISSTLSSQQQNLVIGRYRHIPKLAGDAKGLLILGGDLSQQEKNKIPSGFLSVFDADNRNAADTLVGTGGVAVSCGASARDTISLASRSDGACVASLQRSVRTLSGGVVEPRDVTIRLTREWKLFEILSFCAVMLLGNLDHDETLLL